MRSTETLKRLQRILKDVTTSTYSSFYRNLYKDIDYGDPFPRSWDEWNKIPYLTKKDILDTPYHERVFLPHEEISHISVTSGTSGLGISMLPKEKILSFRQNPQPKRILSFQYPTWTSVRDPGNSLDLLCGDRTHMEETAHLASIFMVDSIFGPPSIILTLTQYLKDQYDLSRVKILHLHGERCSALQEKALTDLFPHAYVQTGYGIREIGRVANSVPDGRNWYPRRLQAVDDIHIEIIDEDGTPLEREGEEGEIIATKLTPKSALPIIRYRTGDIAHIVERSSKRMLFIVLGRTIDQSIRITGGEIRIDAIEQAISALHWKDAILDFTVEVHERESAKGPMPYLVVHIFISDDKTIERKDEIILEGRLARALRVNEKRVYKDGVDKGLYAPLECKIQRLLDPMMGRTKTNKLLDKRK
jgi:phenylacetate-coenzyme A ligase PaaK-like adenylate-forming protein